MILIKICRKCKKFQIIKNDKTGKDMKHLESYKNKKLICTCDRDEN